MAHEWEDSQEDGEESKHAEHLDLWLMFKEDAEGAGRKR